MALQTITQLWLLTTSWLVWMSLEVSNLIALRVTDSEFLCFVGTPRILWCDLGTENTHVAFLQPFLRRNGTDCFSGEHSFHYGKSVSNQVSIFNYINTSLCQSQISSLHRGLKLGGHTWNDALLDGGLNFFRYCSMATLIFVLFYLFFIVIRECSSVVFMMRLTAYIGWFCMSVYISTFLIWEEVIYFVQGLSSVLLHAHYSTRARYSGSWMEYT